MILYLSVLVCLIYFWKPVTCNFVQINVLYQGPFFNQYILCLSISYYNCWFDSIIHYKPTWCNTVFNTNLVIVSLSFVFFTDKPVVFPKLLHPLPIWSTTLSSIFSLSYHRRILNISNTFNNYGKKYLSLYLICSMLHDIQKRKPLYIFNNACWSVILAIMTINLFLIGWKLYLSV